MRVLLILASFLPHILMFVWVRSKRRRLSAWLHTTGEVVELRAQGRSPRTQAPVFCFLTGDGEEYVHCSKVGSSPVGYHVGQVVPVIYDPKNPSRAFIAKLGQIWAAEMIVAAISAFYAVPLFVLAGFFPEKLGIPR